MHQTLKRFLDFIKVSGEKKQTDLFSSKQESKKALEQKSNKQIPDLKDLLKIYEEEWIDDWYENSHHKEEYREKGKQILKDFHAKIKKETPQVAYLEQGFNLKIQDPNTRQVYSFFGVIDRIDSLNGEKVEVIDYKTGSVKGEKTLEKDQLLIYQIAAQEVFKLQPKKLTFYYLNENKPVSFLGSDEELEKMKKKILDFIGKVKESDFRATPSPHNCKYCDYRNICEFRQI
jgi:DNA helicase-2/ATP-dependent DNA helicase PcrA